MFASPNKLLLIVLVAFAVWYAFRWLNRPAPKPMRRRPAGPAPASASASAGAIEDLVACRTCGAYVAPSARRCGKPGCPQPL